MALSWFKISLAMVMILLPIGTRGDDHLTPILNDICKEVECGKGTCQASLGYPFNFKCICDNGWRRTRLDNEETLMQHIHANVSAIVVTLISTTSQFFHALINVPSGLIVQGWELLKFLNHI
ncbi:unnamed protein product [Coffea canephora]|uniref:EGF-like domain-containing protein n=1 Tax=Coffea canephora TaxID=49390 RepID=A0A068ULN4_COFCA|nr:unnamed protein product [Coffea canephora]